MKHEVLTRAIGELDDELIADAYAYKPRKRYALPRFLAAAACLVLVLAAECLNTAVESVVDLVSPDYAELAKHAKDCAAGAVLVCALGAVAVAAAVFVPRLAALFV